MPKRPPRHPKKSRAGPTPQKARAQQEDLNDVVRSQTGQNGLTEDSQKLSREEVIRWERVCTRDNRLNGQADRAERAGRWPVRERKEEKSVTISVRWNLAGHHVDAPEGMANHPYVGKQSHHPKPS